MNKTAQWVIVIFMGLLFGGVAGLSIALSGRKDASREVRRETVFGDTRKGAALRPIPVHLFAIDEKKGEPTLAAQKSSLGKLAFLYDRLQGRMGVDEFQDLLEQITTDKGWDLSAEPDDPRFNDREKALRLLLRKWVRLAPKQAFEAWLDGDRSWNAAILYEEWLKIDPETAEKHYWENWYLGIEVLIPGRSPGDFQ